MLAAIITLHILAVIIWIGGMFFAHFVLRPVVNQLLDLESRLTFLATVFAKFFAFVWVSIILLWLTGITTIILQGGMGQVPPHVHVMLGIGAVMTLLFMYLFSMPYTGLKHALEVRDLEEGIRKLATIRRIILTNLVLGIITTVIAIVGKYIPLF